VPLPVLPSLVALLALHNVAFVLDVARGCREALAAGTFDGWSADWLARYRASGAGSEAGVED
jgi:queuine tRNA-ribosyltransferase